VQPARSFVCTPRSTLGISNRSETRFSVPSGLRSDAFSFSQYILIAASGIRRT
jgi:hypothetical protein